MNTVLAVRWCCGACTCVLNSAHVHILLEGADAAVPAGDLKGVVGNSAEQELEAEFDVGSGAVTDVV